MRTVQSLLAVRSLFLIGAFLIVGVILLTYVHSLGYDFVFDDYLVIGDNTFIRSWANLPFLFSKAYLTSVQNIAMAGEHFIGSGESSYRPLCTLSYFFDYALWKLHPFGFHLTSVAVHVLNSLLAYYCLFLLTGQFPLSLFAALLFAVHPVNAEAVSVVSFREDLLVFSFFLSSFILYVRARNAIRGRKALFASSMALFGAALFSKEMAVSLPVILLTYDFCFGRDQMKKDRYFFLPYAGYIAVLLAYLGVWGYIGLAHPPQAYRGTIVTVLAGILQGVTTYVTKLAWPADIGFIMPPEGPLQAGSVARVFLQSVVLMGALAVAVRSVRTSKLAVFFLLWFFLSLLPVMNIKPLVSPVAYRYLYVPSFGFCVFISCLWLRVYAWVRQRVSSRVALSLSVVVAGSVIFLFMNAAGEASSPWKNNMTFWGSVVQRYPHLRQPRMSLASAYKRARLWDKAIDGYKGIIAAQPSCSECYRALADCYQEKKSIPEAEALYRKALELDPENASIYNDFCNFYLATLNNTTEAIPLCLRAIERDPALWRAYYNLGIAYDATGQKEKAIQAYRSAVARNPFSAEAYTNLAAVYADLHQSATAVSLWEKAVALDPTMAPAHFNLAVHYYENRQYDRAIRHCEAIMKLGYTIEPSFLQQLRRSRE